MNYTVMDMIMGKYMLDKYSNSLNPWTSLACSKYPWIVGKYVNMKKYYGILFRV